MSTLALFEDGKRVEHTEYAVRYLKPGPFEARKGDVEECSEHKARWLTAASTQDELPYHGYPQHGLELVSRTVVTYYGDWHQESAERCSMCRDGVSHSARCHHDEHEVCDRVAEDTDAPKSCACPCHSPADPVRCPKCGGPHPFHDPACVVHPDLIQDQSGKGAE